MLCHMPFYMLHDVKMDSCCETFYFLELKSHKRQDLVNRVGEPSL